MEKAYLEHLKARPPALNTIPINHITPQFRKVSAAIDASLLDSNISYANPNNGTYYTDTKSLTLSGYTVAPYFALSLKTIGLGIAGEFGVKGLKSVAENISDGNEYYYDLRTEESRVDYSGLGIYLYYVPFKKSKRFKFTFIAGGKLINAKHQAKHIVVGDSNGEDYSSQFGAADGGEWETLKYTITRSDIGINLRWQFSKSFGLVPWADYSKTNTNQIDQQLELDPTTNSVPGVSFHRRFAADVEIFWKNRSEIIYGLDVVAKIKRFELHLGSPLGYLVKGDGNSSDEDYTFNEGFSANLSLSYDFKG